MVLQQVTVVEEGTKQRHDDGNPDEDGGDYERGEEEENKLRGRNLTEFLKTSVVAGALT